jgi:hypothetical protein
LQDVRDIAGLEVPVVERHLFKQAQGCTELRIDRSRPVIVQDRVGQRTASEGGRRDRGVSVRSKVALIQARDECGEKLAFTHRPFRGTAHHRLRVRRMRASEHASAIPQRPHDIGRPESGHRPYQGVKQPRP